jgi:hypothetical protein
MRKFIIAICGIMLVGDAIARDHDQLNPTQTNVAPWWNTGESYLTSITDFYPKVADEIAGTDGRSHDRHGTWDDEGAIIIWAAREIYEHGAKFCPVQIQAANENTYHEVWMDYYWNEDDSKWKKCTIVCVKGYSGSKCQTRSDNECPEKLTLNIPGSKPFTNLPDWKSLNPETTVTDANGVQTTVSVRTKNLYNKTESMTVISFKNGSGTNDSDREATHIVLGVVEKVNHGIKVAPIQVIGRRSKTGGGIKSWIKSVQSNGQETLLCYKGYVPSGKECVKKPECGSNNQTSSDEELCENENYGFDKNGKCVLCKTTKTQGVDDTGECIQCKDDDKMFKDGRCVGYNRYDNKDLVEGIRRAFDCWREMRSGDYSRCVKCEGTFNTTTKECE